MSGSLTTGGVDSSIPLQAGKGIGQQPDALTQIGKFATIQNALNQAKLFPGQLQLQGQAIAGNTADLGRVAQVRWAQMMAPILADPNISDDDLPKHGTQAAAVLETMGLPGHMITRSLAATGGPGIRNQYAALARSSTAVPGGEMGAAFPQQDTRVVGNRIQGFQTGQPGSTDAGVPTPVGGGTAIPMSAAELAQPYEYTDANGNRQLSTIGKVALERGVDPRSLLPSMPLQRTPASPSNAPPAISQPQAAPGTARGGVRDINGKPVGPQNAPRYNGPLPVAPPGLAPPVGGDSVPGPGTALPGGGLITVPGTTPGLIPSLEASGKVYDAAMTNESQYSRRVLPLKEAMVALNNTSTGRGTEATNNIAGFLQARAPELYKQFVGEKSADAIKNFDLSNKYLQDYINQSGLAQHSDYGAAMSQAAFANNHISQEASKQVVAVALGLENMQHAALTEFNKTQGGVKGSGKYTTWLNEKFTPSNDPLGYGWGYLPYADKKAIFQTLSDKDKARVLTSYKHAQTLGLTPAQ